MQHGLAGFVLEADAAILDVPAEAGRLDRVRGVLDFRFGLEDFHDPLGGTHGRWNASRRAKRMTSVKPALADLNSLYSEKDSRVPLGHSVDLRFGEAVLLELLEIGQQPVGMNRVQHLPQVA